MKLIVGLGNPGAQYENTRHNIGFMVVDAFVHDLGENFRIWGEGKIGELAQVSHQGEKILLLKPLTFMNLSGQAVLQAAHYFKVLPEDVCVLHDDLDLPFGDVRLKIGGGDGGHNGLKSVTQLLTTSNYSRIRLGIGRPENARMDVANFVLEDFSESQFSTVDQMIDQGIIGINAFVDGVDKFKKEMNLMNKRK